jgi:hypothetical protein
MDQEARKSGEEKEERMSKQKQRTKNDVGRVKQKTLGNKERERQEEERN